jgi:hypothetical protein
MAGPTTGISPTTCRLSSSSIFEAFSMATQPDLWGEIQPATIRTPKMILREQAALLGQKPQNLVEAKVETFVMGDEFHHAFKLVVPALDNYIYQLFEVHHGPGLYPVSLEFRHKNDVETEEKFVEWLRKRLSSDETKKIVGNLLAQASS